MLLSIIIPVYNRPEEVRELLKSLSAQNFFDYETIVVEDGSNLRSEEIVQSFHSLIPNLHYYYIENGGPSKARNYGSQHAQGDYLLILDSDVILPEGYLKSIEEHIHLTTADAFGGPDAASPSFSPVQKAISYAMTSLLTTGGIRGGRADGMEQFKPRTFNMGCRRTIFNQLGGFDESLRYGEDIDFSLRLIAGGFKVCLFKESYVFHKRRIDLRKFFWQVYHSGMTRIELGNRHKGTTKLVHYLPALFTIGTILCILNVVPGGLLLLYALMILLHCYLKEKDWQVAILAIPASFTQLWGYGIGFISGLCLGTDAIKYQNHKTKSSE